MCGHGGAVTAAGAWGAGPAALPPLPAAGLRTKRSYDMHLEEEDTPSKRTRERSLDADSCLAEDDNVWFGDEGAECVGPLQLGAPAAAAAGEPTCATLGSDGSSDSAVLCSSEWDMVTGEEGCSWEEQAAADDFAVSRAPLPITPPAIAPLCVSPRGPAPPPPAPPAAPPRDPELTAMMSALFGSEERLAIRADYLGRHSEAVLPRLYLDSSMRRTAISWLVEVALEYGLHQESLFLAASLLDRFLSATTAVPRSQLQLVSVACMLVAAKHEEELHPSVTDFAGIADNCFSPADLLRMEALVLEVLGFRVNAPTTHTFLSLFKQALRLEPRTCALACYLSELAMLEYEMLAHRPSLVAAAAALVARLHHHDVADLAAMPSITGYSADELRPVTRRLLALQRAAYSARDFGSPYVAVRDKYRSHQWFCAAAATPFACLPLLGAQDEEESGAAPPTSSNPSGGGL